MAGNRLKWDQVQAPNFNGVTDALRLANEAFNKGTRGAVDALGNYDTAQNELADQAMYRQMLQYQTPEDLQAGIASGQALGAAPQRVTAQALQQLGQHTDTLMNRNIKDYGFQRTKRDHAEDDESIEVGYNAARQSPTATGRADLVQGKASNARVYSKALGKMPTFNDAGGAFPLIDDLLGAAGGTGGSPVLPSGSGTPASAATALTQAVTKAVPSSGKLSRAEGLNNFGAIRKSNTPWEGKVNSPDSDFEAFATPEAGIRALSKNLLTYQQKHNIDSVDGLIKRWAPENGSAGGKSYKNNTKEYIAYVSKAVGVQPGDKIDLSNPEVLGKVTTAIAQFENNGSVSFTPEQLSTGVQAALGKGALTASASQALSQAVSGAQAKRIGRSNVDDMQAASGSVVSGSVDPKAWLEAANSPKSMGDVLGDLAQKPVFKGKDTPWITENYNKVAKYAKELASKTGAPGMKPAQIALVLENALTTTSADWYAPWRDNEVALNTNTMQRLVKEHLTGTNLANVDFQNISADTQAAVTQASEGVAAAEQLMRAVQERTRTMPPEQAAMYLEEAQRRHALAQQRFEAVSNQVAQQRREWSFRAQTPKDVQTAIDEVDKGEEATAAAANVSLADRLGKYKVNLADSVPRTTDTGLFDRLAGSVAQALEVPRSQTSFGQDVSSAIGKTIEGHRDRQRQGFEQQYAELTKRLETATGAERQFIQRELLNLQYHLKR